MEIFGFEVNWLGHASFRIKAGDATFYIDPYSLKKPKSKADVVLVTHPHYDHFDPDSIRKIASEETLIIGPKSAQSEMQSKLNGRILGMLPGDVYDYKKEVKVYAVRAYNQKMERLNFHPKSNNWLGYILEYRQKRIYHTGDTDLIPEFSGIKTDVLLVPAGGTYTMNETEAIEAAKIIKPKVVIPMHYKLFSRNPKEVESRMQAELKPFGIDVKILSEEE